MIGPRANRNVVMVGAAVTCAVTLAFFSIYWNRFLGLRSGAGAFFAGHSWLEGLIPYRDYYVPHTPWTLAKSAALLDMFGDKLIVLRAFALVERAVMSTILYFWLVRLFRPRYAALAAITGSAVAACDLADPLASYNMDAILWALSSGFLASLSLTSSYGRRIAALAFLSGIAAGLSLATKHTIGLGVLTAIPVVCGLFLWRSTRLSNALAFILAFVTGAAVALLVMFGWMEKIGVATAFIQQSISGAGAKTIDPVSFFFRFVVASLPFIPAVLIGLLAFSSLFDALRRANGPDADHRQTSGFRELSPVVILSMAALVAGYFSATLSSDPLFWSARQVIRSTIYFSLFGSLYVGVVTGLSLLRPRVAPRSAQYCLFAAVGFTIAATLSVSFPAFETMTFPALALLLSLLLAGTDARWKWVPAAYCILLVFSATVEKSMAPFAFGGAVDAAVWKATTHSKSPELEGIWLPPEAARFIDEAIEIVDKNTTPKDEVFIYPEMGILYGVLHRKWTTSSPGHNIDFVSDEFAAKEAQLLSEKKPAVIIVALPKEEDLLSDERFWRNGRPSGQRDIIESIEKLIKDYKLAASFDGVMHKNTISVYVRQRP
jgi:hypothetical protein